MPDSRRSPDPLATRLADLPAVEQLAFKPVAVRARRDGWTPERQRGFILRLALIGCVTSAAGGVGMTKRSAYKLRDHPTAAGFRAAWELALDWGREQSRDLAIERGLAGEIVPVMYRGRKVGEQVRYDHRLLLAVLGGVEDRRQVAALRRERDRLADKLTLCTKLLAECRSNLPEPLSLKTKDFSRRFEGTS